MACVVPNCQQAKLSTDKLSMHLFPDPMRCPKRHLKWIQAINSEKLFKFDPYVVFKRFRVCRNHFTKDCFNGECKKLLPTAIPTLHLGNQYTKSKSKSFLIYENKILSMLKKNISVDHIDEDDTFNLITIDESHDSCEPEKLWNNIEKNGNEMDNDDEFMLMEIENCENQSQFTIVMPQTEIVTTAVPKMPKVLNYDRKLCLPKSIERVKKPPALPFSRTRLKFYQNNFVKNPKNLFAQNICSKLSVFEAAYFEEKNGSHFNHKIDIIMDNFEKIHWSFTPFVILAQPFMKKFDLKDFEFSQTHFLYHEMLERCYHYLNKVIDTLDTSDSLEDCLLSFRSNDMLKEGGRWNMFSSIINKYGLMPKQEFTEIISNEKISSLRDILRMKLRQYTKDIMNTWKTSKNSTTTLVDPQMSEICDILAISIGIPPEKFNWHYKSSNNETSIVGPLTSLEFYEKYVKPHSNIEDMLCLINDPRTVLKYQYLYTTDNFEDISDGHLMLYNNQPIEVLLNAVTKSISNGEAVLVNCSLNGLNSFKLKNFKLLCDIKINSNMDKSDRIEMGDFSQKYCMIISGVSTDHNGKPETFLIEQYVDDKKMSFSIPKDSFSDIISDIVVKKKFLSNEVKNVNDLTPIILSANDPISNLFM